MQAEEQQQSWKVNIQARAQNCSFKLKATKILPTGKFQRFSLLLRLHKVILKLQLEPGSTVSISSQQKRTLKFAFLRLLEKLRLRRAKTTLTLQHPDVKSALNRLKLFANKKSICAGSLVIAVLTLQHPDVKSALNRLKLFANKKSICAGSLVIAVLALLLQLVFKKDCKGIITHTSIILMYWVLYFNRHTKGKTSGFWIVLIVATAGSWVAFRLGKDYVSKYAWNCMEWSYACAASWCWYAACQVIFALVKIFFSYISKLKEKWF